MIKLIWLVPIFRNMVQDSTPPYAWRKEKLRLGLSNCTTYFVVALHIRQLKLFVDVFKLSLVSLRSSCSTVVEHTPKRFLVHIPNRATGSFIFFWLQMNLLSYIGAVRQWTAIPFRNLSIKNCKDTIQVCKWFRCKWIQKEKFFLRCQLKKQQGNVILY